MINEIQYGFGKEYLPNWNIEHALREVFQNYMDYGRYESHVKVNSIFEDLYDVTIKNDYKPNNLEFLRIGNSMKEDGSIGKHGEGLKMAFLIFLREGYYFGIRYEDKLITARFKSTIIGEVLTLDVTIGLDYIEGFITNFTCKIKVFDDFTNNKIVREEEILYTDFIYGDIVNKTNGNIYSGGLYVCFDENISKSYNIKPEHLPLDRDRSVPREFDLSWAISKINESRMKSVRIDSSSFIKVTKENEYINFIPDEIVDDFKQTTISGKIEFIHKTSKELVKNNRVTQILRNHPKFKKSINTSDRKLFRELSESYARTSPITILKQVYSNSSKENKDLIKIVINKLKNKKK